MGAAREKRSSSLSEVLEGGAMSDFGIELARFTLAMAERLEANRHKEHWNPLSFPWLLHRLRQETGELERALEEAAMGSGLLLLPSRAGAVIHEAADVANFAMMIADLARTSEEKP